jgi:hypothetical protein
MPEPMKPKERVMVAITLQECDWIPCNLTSSYFVARYNGVTIEDYLTDQGLNMELNYKTFEDLGGNDMISLPPLCFGNSPVRLKFLPVLSRRLGIELPSDIIPHYGETERMPLSNITLLLRMDSSGTSKPCWT